MKTRSIITFLLFILFSGTISFSQIAWDWAFAEQCEYDASGMDVVVDSLDNIYVVGFFGGQAQFGSTSLNSVGNSDIFIIKTDKDGNYFWVKQFGTTGSNYGSSITLDDSLNVYVSGSYNSNASSIIIKLDNDGELKWQHLLDAGYFYNEKGKTLTYSKNTICFATANTLYSINNLGDIINSQTISINSVSTADNGNFIVANSSKVQELQANLNLVNEYILPSDIVNTNAVVLKDSNIYLTGYYNGTLNIGDSTFIGSNNMFITKLDTSGVFQWANQCVGTDWSMGNALVVNDDNKVFVSGYYRNLNKFDDIDVGEWGKFIEIFVAEYDYESGKVNDLIIAGGGDNDIAYGMTQCSDGNFVVTGSIFDPWDGVNFGDVLVECVTGNEDFFLAKTKLAEVSSSFNGEVLKDGSPTQANIKLFKFNQDGSTKRLYNYQTGVDGTFDLDVYSRGTYILKAHHYSSTHISTYYDDEYLWDYATEFQVDKDTAIGPLNIELIDLPDLTGTNSISGTILGSDSLPKRFIDVLLVSKGVPQAYTLSDSMGHYRFENIPRMCRYDILVDTAGILVDAFYTVGTYLKAENVDYSGYDYVISNGVVYLKNEVPPIDDPSDTVVVDPPVVDPQSINDLNNSEISVYPIPAKNTLNIDGLENINFVSLDIVDYSGKVVLSSNVKSNQLDLSTLSNGIYNLRINTENSIIQKKIVVSR